jgi:hypothetical protein
MDIAKKLAVVGVNVDASQVHLPVHMSTPNASPNLEIVAAQPLKGNQVRLELRCATASQCLPFLATVDADDPKAVSAAIELKTGSTNTPGHQNDQELRKAGAAAREALPKLKVGSQAILEIRDDRMDIHLHVLAIDPGTVGQQVRVCTSDRKKIFHATVTGDGTVTGVME